MQEGSSRGSLILEARPSHLPAKSPEEEERHRLEYEQMVQAAKKKGRGFLSVVVKNLPE